MSEIINNTTEVTETNEAITVEVKDETTLEKIKNWCAEHKKELIIGGITLTGVTVAVIFGVKKYKEYKKATDIFDAICKPDPNRIDLDLPVADNASITMRDKWAGEMIKTVSDTTDIAGKTLVQSMANVPWDWENGILPKSDMVKLVDSNADNLKEAIIDGLAKILDEMSPEAIKSISMTYDIV